MWGQKKNFANLPSRRTQGPFRVWDMMLTQGISAHRVRLGSHRPLITKPVFRVGHVWRCIPRPRNSSGNHTIYNCNTLIPDRSLAWLCLRPVNIIFPRRRRSCVLVFVMALIFFAAYCAPSLENPIISLPFSLVFTRASMYFSTHLRVVTETMTGLQQVTCTASLHVPEIT